MDLTPENMGRWAKPAFPGFVSILNATQKREQQIFITKVIKMMIPRSFNLVVDT